jgi:hypothetical protein
MLFKLISDVKSKQRDCSMVLTFSGEKLSLSYDVAIEFKIQIAYVLESGRPTGQKIVSEAESWSAQIVPNTGGFGIAVEQSPRSTVKLWLNATQAEGFSADLQKFIDAAGGLS